MNYSIIEKDMQEIYNNGLDYNCFRNKTIIITGAYGMLASYFTKFFMFLEQYGIRVNIIIMVRNKQKFFDRFPESKNTNNIKIYETDLNERISIESKVDYIIHAASFASPDYYDKYPIEVIQPNVIGTMNLLEYAKKNLSADGCFVYFSAGNIYGECNSCDEITENTFGGIDPLHIYNCYTESKRMGETLCKVYSIENNINFKSLRIWHTFSPYMNIDKDPRAFASFIKDMRDNKNIEIHSDGTGMRSFCYVTDAISMMLYVIVKGNNNDAYNICNTKEFVSIKELAQTIVQLRKEKGLKVILKKRNINENYTENVVLKNVKIPPSNSKVVKLGFEPKISIAEGFERVLEYLEL